MAIPQSFETHTFTPPNLLPEEPGQQKPERPPRRGMRFFSCALLVILIFVTSCTLLLAHSNKNFFVGVKNGFLIRQLTHLFTGSNYSLKGEAEDRINFLLLGMGGPGHEGPYLSDTIILASFKPSTKEVALMSIPRDLIVTAGNGMYQKVNSVYALNINKGAEQAFAETKRVIGETFNIPIQYMGVIDFQGFVKLVDDIGGVDVTVDRSFRDPLFPNSNYGYETTTFTAGAQHMDGKTALMFARSRHGNNGEGSDFARSARQQKIMLAAKKKISTYGTLLNPFKLTTLYNLVTEYTRTDMEPWEMVKMVQLAKDVKTDTITNIVLDDSPTGYLRSGISSIDGAFILQPREGNYTRLQLLAQNMLHDNRFALEKPVVLLQNGTPIPSLGSRIGNELSSISLKPIAITNAQRQSYTSTVIYDYTNGAKKLTREFLENRFHTKAQTDIPIDLLSYTLTHTQDIKDASGQYPNLDFLVILGEAENQSDSSEIIRTLTPAELASSTATSTQPLIPLIPTIQQP